MVCFSDYPLYYYIYIYIYIYTWEIHFTTFSQAIQTTNIVEEWVDDAHAQLKNEEARQVVAVKTLVMVEKKIKDLGTKLSEVDKEKKSAEVALVGAEKQVEDQHLQLCKAKELRIDRVSEKRAREERGSHRPS